MHFIVQRAQWFSIRTRLTGTPQDCQPKADLIPDWNRNPVFLVTGNSRPQKISLFLFSRKRTIYSGAWWAYEGPHPWVGCSNWRLFSVYHVPVEGSWTYSDALKWILRFRKGQAPCELYHLLLTSSSSILLACSLLVLHPSVHPSIHPPFSRFKILSLSLPYLLVCSPAC